MSEFISPWIYFVCSEFSNVYFQIQLKIILYVLVEWISDKYQIFQNV